MKIPVKMPMPGRCLALLAILFAFSFTQAAQAFDQDREKQEEQQVDHNFSLCMKYATGTSEMLSCGKEVFDFWDARLNANYKAMQKACDKLDNAQQCRKELKDMERTWISYKDKMTNFIYTINGDGSISRVEAQDFLIKATKLQAESLRR